MVAQESTAWYSWALTGILALLNLFVAYLIVPLRSDVKEVKKDMADCQLKHGPKMFHLEAETARQAADLLAFTADLTEIKERTARTETEIKGIVATNLRIESKIDKLNGSN